MPRVATDSEQFKAFARPFFAALQQHLSALGLPGSRAGIRRNHLLVATVDRLTTEVFDPRSPSFKPGELRLSLTGSYAGAWAPARGQPSSTSCHRRRTR